MDSAAADMQTVPATVIMFGVTGVRASPCTMGLNRRAKKGRRKFSMAESILLGGACALTSATFVVISSLPHGFSLWVLW